ncbi:MAG TPA: hypothetical protein VLI04_14890, partial [Nocardioidaceae bacterium]|nr:hypothetical protein [Nocardioidaceae bacterium]
MNPEVKQKWVDRLRSGQDVQTQGTLKRMRQVECDDRPAGLCCLGVLCEVAVAEGVIPPATVHGEWHIGNYGGDVASLPHAVVKWAETDSSVPVVTYDGAPQGL